MDASVLIPTFGRPDKLASGLAALARQTLDPGRFEVVVGFDGPDPAAAAAAQTAWDGAGGRASLRLIACERRGYTLVRNRILAAARGRVMVSLNDDVRPAPDFLRHHLAEHDRRREAGLGPSIVVGHSPFIPRTPETLLDRLVVSTPMVFFYDAMTTSAALADRDRDWGFRHCFGLNFSVPLACVREVGGFFARPHLYGYDDIELGFRLAQRYRMPVLFRPEALAGHDHHYQPVDLLGREHQLGIAAWAFAGANPAFGLACFGRDIRSAEELAYSRGFCQREGPAAERAREAFLTLGELPASTIDGPHEAAFLRLLHTQFMLLKRWTWRTGLLEAAHANA